MLPRAVLGVLEARALLRKERPHPGVQLKFAVDDHRVTWFLTRRGGPG